MSNRSRIGTPAETAAKRWLQDNGWPDADRQPLRGNRDQGDLIVCRTPLVIAEVKAGAQAENASDALIAAWLTETDTEAVHAGADLGVLIVRRFRRPVARWDAYMRANDMALILTGASILYNAAPWPVRMTLADWSAAALAWLDGAE